jgi:uncharacterized protein (UPF0297 family)
MAERYERYRRSKRESRLRLPTPAVEKEQTKYDPAKQVEGYEKRLEGSGIDVEQATDKRNFVEKALNLKEDQNFFFDVFEVLGRPQQALFNGIKALQEGESFGKGFKEGLTGEDYTNFSQILNEAGLGEEDSFGVDDVLGFVGDVFLDPIDLALMGASIVAAPATGGTSLLAGTGLVTALNATTDAAKLADAVKNVANFVNVGQDVAKLNVLQKIKKGAKATGRLYADIGMDIAEGQIKKATKKLFTSKPIKLSNGLIVTKTSVTDLTMKPFKAVFKYGGKAVGYTAKFGVVPIVAGIKGKDLKSATDIVESAFKSIESMFNQGARLGSKLLTEAQISINKLSGNKVYAEAWRKSINLKMDDIVDKVYKSRVASGEVIDVTEEVLRRQIKEEVNRNLLEFAEVNYFTETSINEVLTGPNRKIIPLDDKVRNEVKKALNRPAFQSLKQDIARSLSSQKVYTENATKLKNALIVSYEDTIAKLTVEEDITAYRKLIGELKAKDLKASDLPNIRRSVVDAINDPKVSDETTQALNDILNQVDDIIAKDAYNIVDDLYEFRIAEGKPVYVLRQGAERIIEDIERKAIQLSEILDDTMIDTLSKGRFATGGVLETRLRKLLRDSNSGKQLEDLFEELDGQWIARSQDELNDILELSNPKTFMEKTIEGPRFRTDAEIAELNAKYGPDFEYRKEYEEIVGQMEEAMQFIDESYGTEFFKPGKKGYIRHAITPEAKEYKKARKVYDKFFENVDKNSGDYILIGNTKTFAGRKYEMSVAEANRISRFNTQRLLEAADDGLITLTADERALITNRLTENLFSEYFTDSFADTLIKMDSYGSAIKVMDTALVGGALADKDVLRFADATDDIPLGFERVPTVQLKNKLEAMSRVYKDNESMKRIINEITQNKKAYSFIDANVFQMIGRLGDEKQINAFVKMVNGTNNMFKRLKIFSAGFHFKNLVGNASNLYLAGVPASRIPTLLWEGVRKKKVAKKLIEDFTSSGKTIEQFIQGLSQDDQLLFRAYNLFLNAGFEDAGKMLYDLDELMLKQGDKAFTSSQKLNKAGKLISEKKYAGGLVETIDSGLQLNIEINQIVDNGYRLGYLKSLLKDGLSEEEALLKVRTALFDPSAMTAFENNTIRKFIPFYTFAKKNLAFQMRNVFDNTVQYKRFVRGIRSTWNAIGVDWEEDLQPYQKENLWLPIPLKLKDGKYFQLKTSFPVSDLGEYLNNPAEKILSSLTPLIRAPFEVTVNRQIFSGQEIQRFEGERGRDLGFLGLTASQEYLVEQTGLERLAAPVTNVVSLLQNKDAARIAPTIVSQGDVETARRSAAYDQLDQLRGLFQYYKQEEIPILTLSEIENINKPRSTLAQRLQAIQAKRGR